MTIEDIKRNFEFLYFGRGRHLCTNHEVLDEPLEVLRTLEGKEQVRYEDKGSDKVDVHFIRGHSFELHIFSFADASLRVYCTREEYPDDPRRPAYVTRVRIGQYDLVDKTESKKAREVSKALSDIPPSD